MKISSKQRVKLAVEHKETDRVPLNYNATPEAEGKMIEYLKVKDREYLKRRLGIDIRVVTPKYVGPKLETLSDDTFYNCWGVKYKRVSYGNGKYDDIVFSPLSNVENISELDKYKWPDVNWWNYDSLNETIDRINEKEEYAILLHPVHIGSASGIFEIAWSLRGFEKMFIDFASSSEIAIEIMKRITDFYIEFFKNSLDATKGKVDIIQTADDLGGQEGLLMSPDMWGKYIYPHHKRLNSFVKKYGVRINYHSCGSVTDLIEELIEMGIDILEPLQFSAKGMEPDILKDRFGDRLCFNGGIDVQQFLPGATVDETKNEVNRLVTILGKQGGYILGPGHNFQVDTPCENILAIYDKILE